MQGNDLGSMKGMVSGGTGNVNFRIARCSSALEHSTKWGHRYGATVLPGALEHSRAHGWFTDGYMRWTMTVRPKTRTEICTTKKEFVMSPLVDDRQEKGSKKDVSSSVLLFQPSTVDVVLEYGRAGISACIIP